MGQANCVNLCGDRNEPEGLQLDNMMNTQSDEPTPKFAKKVKQHIELHPKIKEIYLIYRNQQHSAEYKGIKLELYYLFSYSAYYEGQWKNGLPNGFGRVIYDDGSLYEGCFNKGIAQCEKALFIKNGNTFYKGQIKNNKANGEGELITPNCTIKGKFLNDVPHGRARQTYNESSFFQGEFVNGVKTGQGYYRWNSDESYTGKFRANKIEGKGRIENKEYVYEGQFSNNKKNGKGEYYDKKGKFKYYGEFSNDSPIGNGKIIYDDDTIFTGIFNGFDRRKGTLTLKTGKSVPINTYEQTTDQAEIVLVHKYSKN